jgi:hypothetical protein
MTRFRLPFVVFEYLVKISSEFNLFGYTQNYKVTIPAELKLMAILRMLGRGECLDTISEMSGLSITSAHRIFKTWTHNFVRYCKGDFLSIPEGDELKEIMESKFMKRYFIYNNNLLYKYYYYNHRM